MAGVLDEWEGGCDWTRDPWFLRAECEGLFQPWGLGFEQRRRAAHALARVYSPTVCREIRAQVARGFGPVITLFANTGWPGPVASLLQLGLDLEAAEPWAAGDVLGRLTKRDHFSEAAFEIRVWANLRRSGYPVKRVEEKPSQKRPDFTFEMSGETLQVEVKLANPAQLDEAAEALNRRLDAANLHVEGLHLALIGSRQLAERALEAEHLTELEALFDGIVDAFKAAVQTLLLEGARPGRYRAGSHGFVDASPGPKHGSVELLVVPDLPPRKKAARVARRIRDGWRQLTLPHRGIVLLGVNRFADLGLVAQAMMELRPLDFAPQRNPMVAFADFVQPETSKPVVPLVYPVSTSKLVKLDADLVRFAEVAAGSQGHVARRITPARTSDPHAFALDTRRRTTTSVRVASVAYQPNTRVSIPFDGSEPTVTPLSPSDEPE